jgi:hypothetical protein
LGFGAIAGDGVLSEADSTERGGLQKPGGAINTPRFKLQRRTAMLVAMEHREKLNRYCLIRKITQERAVNEMIGEALQKLDADPVMGEALKRAEELQRELDTLLQQPKTQAAGA